MHSRWPWSAPVLVAFVVIFLPFLLVKAIAAVIAIGVVVVVGRRPVGAITALVVLVPFHQLLFALAYRFGTPGELVRAAVQWKEVVIAGLIVAGVRTARRVRPRLDLVDRLALGYVALGTGYLLVPRLFVGGELGSTLDLTTRSYGWRTDVLYVALFLACRHLRLPHEALTRLRRTFLVTATVIAAIGLFEFVFPATWNNIVVNWLDMPAYKLDILRINRLSDIRFADIRVYTSVAGRDVLRIGSVFLDYESLGFYLPLAVALLADLVVRGLARPVHYVALFVTGGAVLLTETRSAVLAFGIVLFITLFRRPKETASAGDARIRFTLVVAAIAVIAIPAAFAVGLVNRFNGKDDVSSNTAHKSSFDVGYGILLDHPLGRGLATAAGAGQRADVNGNVITETQYLQIGTQLGVVGLALWVGTLIGTIFALGRAVDRAPPWADPGMASAFRTVLIAFVVAGAFLQIFLDFGVSWSVWGLGGAALGALERVEERAAPAAPPRAALRR